MTEAKQSCSDFTNFISQHDIICLSETWTKKNSKIDLNGYSDPIHSYRHFQNRRAKRASGGIIIYIKDSVRRGIKLIKNDIDCLLWLKVDKNYFHIEEDIYIAVAYIAPENSRFTIYMRLKYSNLSKMTYLFFSKRVKYFCWVILIAERQLNQILLITIG